MGTFDLTQEQKEVCSLAVAKYGRRAQALKVAEELRELAAEIELAAQPDATLVWPSLVANLVDERADVAIMLYQLDELLLPALAPLVSERIQFKIERLKNRMEV